MNVYITQSNRKNKKWMANIPQLSNKWIHFGDNRYQDFTQHKSRDRQKAYINRHLRREADLWDKTGIQTPSFWSKWLLWSRPNMEDAVRYMNTRFKLNIQFI